MLTIEVIGDKALLASLSSMPQRMRQKLRAVIGDQMIALRLRVQQRIGTLFVQRSGKLMNSIKADMSETPSSVEASVFSEGVVYARIHEYGGIINHPGSSKLQAWTDKDGRLIVTHYTKPHEIPIPERSYLRASLAERRAQIDLALYEAVGIVVHQ